MCPKRARGTAYCIHSSIYMNIYIHPYVRNICVYVCTYIHLYIYIYTRNGILHSEKNLIAAHNARVTALAQASGMYVVLSHIHIYIYICVYMSRRACVTAHRFSECSAQCNSHGPCASVWYVCSIVIYTHSVALVARCTSIWRPLFHSCCKVYL